MDRVAWQALADKWDIVMMAPQAFIAALGIGAVGGWLLARIVYNNRLTHYQELIANYRDVLDDNLPARALRPFPIKRSKQMSLGLVFIFVGISAVIIGAFLVATDRSPAQSPKTSAAVPSAGPPAISELSQSPITPVNPLPNLTPPIREFTDRTPRELLALYDGRTPLQADPLMDPFKGKWIKAEGKILNLIPDGIPGASIAVLKDGERIIECRLDARWGNQVRKLSKEDAMGVVGKIALHQNGSQLYLQECEITSLQGDSGRG